MNLQEAGTGVELIRPEVRPYTVGQVDTSLGSPFIDNRRDQYIRTEEVFVAEIDHIGIIGKVEYESTHNRYSGGA
jgi:hypothetical protein